MNRILMDTIFPIFNRLYYKCPKLYLKLYFGYKNIIDVDKIIFLNSWMKSGDVAVDIGANTGFYTKLLSNMVGELGEVHSFEPDDTNYKFLKSISTKFRNIYSNKVAVSNQCGYLNLYFSNNRNTDHQTFNIGQKRISKKVPCISVDNYFKKINKRVNLIKLDIQGFDYYALLGMVDTLKKSKRVAIIGELWPYALSKAGSDPLDYLKLLSSLGFKIKNKKFRNSDLKKEINNPYYFIDYIATKP